MSKRKRIKGNGPIRKGEFDDQMTTLQECKDLWAAKLLAFLHDAVQPRQVGVCVAPDDAQRWFGSRDFRETCECAGFDPEDVMASFHQRMEFVRQERWTEAQEGVVSKGRTPK